MTRAEMIEELAAMLCTQVDWDSDYPALRFFYYPHGEFVFGEMEPVVSTILLKLRETLADKNDEE
jgi:hypothetical protein